MLPRTGVNQTSSKLSETRPQSKRDTGSTDAFPENSNLSTRLLSCLSQISHPLQVQLPTPRQHFSKIPTAEPPLNFNQQDVTVNVPHHHLATRHLAQHLLNQVVLSYEGELELQRLLENAAGRVAAQPSFRIPHLSSLKEPCETRETGCRLRPKSWTSIST